MRSAAEAANCCSRTRLRASRTRRLPLRRNSGGKGSNLRLRYRAYLREGAIRPSADRARHRPIRRPAEHLDLRRLSSRRAVQLDPRQRADLGKADVAVGRAFGDVLHPELDQGQGHRRSDPVRRRPDKARSFPELPYVTCGSVRRLRAFQCRLSGLPTSAPSIGRSIAGCSCRNHGASRGFIRA